MSQLFVDISQEIEFPIYDEENQCYYTHTATIAEMLRFLTDFRHIVIYENTAIKWGLYEEIQKK